MRRAGSPATLRPLAKPLDLIPTRVGHAKDRSLTCPTPLRRDLPPFRPGDTVRVHVNIREGDKERVQIFEGVVTRRRGRGPSATFTVRKISYGVGVERIFPIESPQVKKVEIKARGHVRRARLYYLRELVGKKARLRSKMRDLSGLISAEAADAGHRRRGAGRPGGRGRPARAGRGERREGAEKALSLRTGLSRTAQAAARRRRPRSA